MQCQAGKRGKETRCTLLDWHTHYGPYWWQQQGVVSLMKLKDGENKMRGAGVLNRKKTPQGWDCFFLSLSHKEFAWITDKSYISASILTSEF